MKSRTLITLTIVIIMAIITIPTVYKIYNNHNINLVKVVENEFLYQAKKCFNKDECSKIIYLSDLYEKGYILEKLSNPITKKYYSEKSYIDIENQEIQLID
ncbi:MAG: hypothetical protein E7163_05130 [Firmicutes bacterium]|nr:hypothetical protein [Bacillota bacterium]